MRLPNGSGVKREFHAPFCERLAGKFCWSTLPELTKEKIVQEFGKNIANQVQDLTRIKENGVKISSAEMIEILYKERKHDVMLIKLFDRLHNMQTISAKSPEKIIKIINETIRGFLILSTYLELPEIKFKLLKLCYHNLTTLDYPILNQYELFSLDNFQPLFPIFQNGINQKHILSSKELL